MKYDHKVRPNTKKRVLKAQSLYTSYREMVNPSTNRKYTHDEAIIRISEEMGVTPKHVRGTYLSDRRNYLSSTPKTS
jgi:hypothetical protein